ncbi:MAG: PAS domain S-box protein, partial [Rhodospirillales bacterium]|nr:PAS domain S-box protein [Rhodospirillales bacterium]
MTGRLIKYMALVLISVFILAIVWEFKIEATVLPLLGISEIEESAATHWRFVVASTGFTILAMIIPFFLLYKSDVQRSAVQNSLIESERFRRELINCPPESIFMIDNEGVVLVANEYGARGLGLAPGDVIGKNIFEVVPPEVANERLGYLRRILKRPETTITTDFRDGQWFETIAEPHLNEIGEVERISLFARNITERKLAELAMQDSEKSLRAFIDATIDYAALVDSDGTFRIANQPMAHKYGLTKEELIGRPMFSRPLSETGRRRKQWLDDVLNTGRAIRETDEQDGRWYDSSYYPVIAGDGKVTQVAVFARDITEQKIVENELTAAKASSESANRAKSEFLSSVSHELRTPLNAIMGFGQLLEIDSKEPLSERQLAYTQQILNGGEHLIELIDQVLELSKIEAGKFSLSIEKVDPTNVVGECLNMVKERARENDVTLVDLTNEANLPILWVDKSRFIQVLLNLLSNAIKYNR